jgi:hypothetical protein
MVYHCEYKSLSLFVTLYSKYLMKVALVALFCVALPLALAQTACTNIPADHVYYLTSFCDQTTACGKSCGNCNFYYAADSQRFKCGSTINCARAGKNANLEVIDYGPNCDLEKKSGKPIIDASYSTCKLFTGSTSCGWSDKLAVTCVKVGTPAHTGKFHLGECTWDGDRTDLPFCHLPENRNKYNQHNIHEWVELQELREMESIFTS